jgi:ABC-type transporter Mla maintaining outer membrane lipid asymmetry permease subunit MlaE
MLPALTAIADIVGVFAGFLIAVFQLHEPGRLYLDAPRTRSTTWTSSRVS